MHQRPTSSERVGSPRLVRDPVAEPQTLFETFDRLNKGRMNTLEVWSLGTIELAHREEPARQRLARKV
ncbi:MAG: hypothetical protein KF901_05925 [Myxococcales bacterium]|nr:hypothetical protein [Myxococcales bacterium]